MFTKLISALKATRRTIVFTEGPDARILEAADRLIKDDLMDVILIGNVDEVQAAAAKGGFDIAKAEIIDPATYAGMDEMVAKMVELRKGKMSEEDCRAALAKGNYFGTMLRLNGEIKQSHLGAFLARHYGQTVSRDDFNAAVAEAYGKQNVRAFKLTCNGNPAYLTEMQISIKAAAINAPLSADSFLPQPHPGNCGKQFLLDKAG